MLQKFQKAQELSSWCSCVIRALSISANVLGDLGFILKRVKVINCNLKKRIDIYKEYFIEFLLQKQKS